MNIIIPNINGPKSNLNNLYRKFNNELDKGSTNITPNFHSGFAQIPRPLFEHIIILQNFQSTFSSYRYDDYFSRRHNITFSPTHFPHLTKTRNLLPPPPAVAQTSSNGIRNVDEIEVYSQRGSGILCLERDDKKKSV